MQEERTRAGGGKMKSVETQECRKRQIISHQSQRWAVLKRTWETQDWLRRQSDSPPDWSDGAGMTCVEWRSFPNMEESCGS